MTEAIEVTEVTEETPPAPSEDLAAELVAAKSELAEALQKSIDAEKSLAGVRAELAETHKQLATAQTEIAAKDQAIFQLRNENLALTVTAKTLGAIGGMPQVVAR